MHLRIVVIYSAKKMIEKLEKLIQGIIEIPHLKQYCNV